MEYICKPALRAAYALSHSEYLMIQLLLLLPRSGEENQGIKASGLRYSAHPEGASILSSETVHVKRGERGPLPIRILPRGFKHKSKRKQTALGVEEKSHFHPKAVMQSSNWLQVVFT